MTEINIQIRDADTFECDGKTYRAVAYRRPEGGVLCVDCGWITKSNGCFSSPRLIVTEVKPLHRTPTDEDAKRRPRCEYRDYENMEWCGDGGDRLIFVAGERRFVVSHADGTVVEWQQCRIPNEDT